MISVIELINPSGQRKELPTSEYIELLGKYLKTKAFAEWSNKRNISGTFKVGKEERTSVSAIEMFLKDTGYKINMINK